MSNYSEAVYREAAENAHAAEVTSLVDRIASLAGKLRAAESLLLEISAVADIAHGEAAVDACQTILRAIKIRGPASATPGRGK